jgi:AraC family transcriptional regulator, regulatory protein of adaptative response / methylated-DNA-[protein]-cysteine methyltransferase
MLNHDICEAARQRRDPAYDGVFFIAVRTTGIYCRPVCRVRMPFARNVRFYPSAAAAEAAGYRPCLRCRPESAPQSPAWQGTLATVSRALKLIDAGALDGDTVPHLADRLGIGPRHLSRLFARHVGASPAAVARTRRIQRAKLLLSDSVLPLADVAHAAGFGSVRRLHDAITCLYGRPPSALRPRHARRGVQP